MVRVPERMQVMSETIIVALITSLLGSSVTNLIIFFINRHDSKKESDSKVSDMVLGLAHDRLLIICMEYIKKGHISAEEFDDLNRYLYIPYRNLGGNGTVEKLFNEVSKLPTN